MNSQAFTPEQIAAVVREVMRRLIRADLPSERLLAPVSPAQPAAASAGSQPAGSVTIAEKLVTGASLATVPAGTRVVSLRHDALITPSARDAARAAGIALVRSAKGAGNVTGPAAQPRPLFVATADCPGDIAARTASLVRALPNAQRLPATGLSDVVASLGLHLTRDGGRAILLAGRPHVATALANRSAGVRAVTARDTQALLAAAEECAANLLVVSPRDMSGASLERIAVTFATRAPVALPADFAPATPAAAACPCSGGPTAPAAHPCTCSTHHH